MLHVPLVDLLHRDTYCLEEEIQVACHLVHFLSFWKEVIQADRWVLEIIRYGYSIELIQPASAVQQCGGSLTKVCNSTNS